jgi:hypothetical protein
MWSTGNLNFSRYFEKHPQLSWENWKGDSLSHAWCFHGADSANTILYTMELARRLLCDTPVCAEPCGLCEGCQAYLHGNEYRFQTVFPRGQSILIDQIRSLMNYNHQLEQGKRMIILIPFVDRLNKEAANAFLKSLEEPLSGRIYLFVNPGSKPMLPTISSRVNQVHLPSASSLADAENEVYHRLEDYNLFGFVSKHSELLDYEGGLGEFYALINEELAVESQDMEKGPYELLLKRQLISGRWAILRRLSTLNFLDKLFIEEYTCLEKEISNMKRAMDSLFGFLLDSGKNIRKSVKDNVGKSYRHWLMDDYSVTAINRFNRGFLFRELEQLLLIILRTAFLLGDDTPKDKLHLVEQQLLVPMAGFKGFNRMTELNRELVSTQQMIYNNLPWDSLLENLGLYLLKVRSEADD